MADKKEIPNPDAPNDDIEALSADEQAALDDRSTVGQARREEDAAIIAKDEQPEPQPKAAAKPEEKPAAEAKPEDKPEAKHVPLATLLEERREFQRKLEEREREDREARAALTAKLELVTQRLTKPAEPPKPLDVDANPIEALKQTRQQVDQLSQLQIQQLQRVQFAGHVAAQVHQFKAAVPDYDDAYKFAVEATRRELKARGYPEAQIPGILENGEFQLAEEAIRLGKNPGQHFYDFAMARGYQKPQPQQQQPTVTAEQKIETANKGQANAKSLSGGGSPPPAKLSLADLETMSESEIANMSDDKFRALFGA